jgi:hypothetical protein
MHACTLSQTRNRRSCDGPFWYITKDKLFTLPISDVSSITDELILYTTSNFRVNVRALIYAQGPTDPERQGGKEALINGIL